MATDAQTLMSLVSCYTCETPGNWQLLKLALLKQILLASNPMADTSAQGLMNQATCYSCVTPGLWPLLELGLLAQISAAGVSGGSAGFSGNYGGGTPTPVPTSAVALAVDTSNNAVWIWFGGAWHNTGLTTS